MHDVHLLRERHRQAAHHHRLDEAQLEIGAVMACEPHEARHADIAIRAAEGEPELDQRPPLARRLPGQRFFLIGREWRFVGAAV